MEPTISSPFPPAAPSPLPEVQSSVPSGPWRSNNQSHVPTPKGGYYYCDYSQPQEKATELTQHQISEEKATKSEELSELKAEVLQRQNQIEKKIEMLNRSSSASQKIQHYLLSGQQEIRKAVALLNAPDSNSKTIKLHLQSASFFEQTAAHFNNSERKNILLGLAFCYRYASEEKELEKLNANIPLYISHAFSNLQQARQALDNNKTEETMKFLLAGSAFIKLIEEHLKELPKQQKEETTNCFLQAATCYEKVAQNIPGSEYHLMAGYAHEGMAKEIEQPSKEHEKAKECFRKSVGLYTQASTLIETDPDKAKSLYQLGQKFFQKAQDLHNQK